MQYDSMKSRFHRMAASGMAAVALFAALVCASEAKALAFDKAHERADRAARKGEYEEAAKLYRELIEKNGTDTAARLGLSFTLLKQRNLLDAYDQAARVIAIDPLSARAHAIIGAVTLAAGDFRLSVEEFRTALSLKNDEALAVAGLAMVDFYDGRSLQSLQGLRHAVDLDPDEPDYLFNLAQAAARSEQYKEAADAYEKFLAIAPRTDADRRARIRGLIDFLRYLGKQNALYIPSGSTRAALPFETVDNRPVIEIRVNGRKEPSRFVIDTGSGMTVVSEEAAQRFGLKPVARGGLARAVGGGGRFEIVYGFLSSLDLSGARIENVPIYIRAFYDKTPGVDGYIGLGVLSKFLATVDYGERMLVLSRKNDAVTTPLAIAQTASVTQPTDGSQSAPLQTVGAIELPMRTSSSGFLSGEVQLDGINKLLNFIIDTGASISVISSALAEREDMSRFEQATKMRVYGAAGVAENVKMLLLPRLAFGAHSRERISAAVLDLEPINETAGFDQTGIIGGNFLKNFRVTFDFQRAIIRLEPIGSAAPPTDGPTSVNAKVDQ